MTEFFHYLGDHSSEIYSRGIGYRLSGKKRAKKIVTKPVNFPKILPHILSPAFRADLRRFRFRSRDNEWILLGAQTVGPRLEEAIYWTSTLHRKVCKSCRISISYYPNNHSVVVLENAADETFWLNPDGFTPFCPVCLSHYARYVAERPVYSMGIVEHLNLCTIKRVIGA